MVAYPKEIRGCWFGGAWLSRVAALLASRHVYVGNTTTSRYAV